MQIDKNKLAMWAVFFAFLFGLYFPLLRKHTPPPAPPPVVVVPPPVEPPVTVTVTPKSTEEPATRPAVRQAPKGKHRNHFVPKARPNSKECRDVPDEAFEHPTDVVIQTARRMGVNANQMAILKRCIGAD
jgi:hypothetical protein